MARKILLADDSVTAQNMGRKILADAGYEVITVNNGSAALKKIGETRPDLIVLDVYMPGYSGLEVCQRLKEVAETSRIPILLTVGKLEPFKPEEAKRVRADAFIVKPFEASELLSALSKLEDKVVPRADASKPGRFARATAAIEESRYDKSVADDEDSGWKTRISFPKKKKEEPAKEEVDTAEIYNPVNKDLRTTVAHKEDPAPAPQSQAAPAEDAPIHVGALAPEGLPKDVTPEEIAALAAAAAQIQGKVVEEKSAPTGHEAASIPAPVESGKPQGVAPGSVEGQQKAETREEAPAAQPASLPEVATNAAPATLAVQASPEKLEEKKPEHKSGPAEVMAAIAGLETEWISLPAAGLAEGPLVPRQKESHEPVTMAVAAGAESSIAATRWTAVSVALAPEEAAMSLEQEMQKAYAAFAAAESGHALPVTPSETPAGEIVANAAAAPELPTPEPVSSQAAVIPAAPPPEVVQPLSALSEAATDAVSAAVKELEAAAAKYEAEQKSVSEERDKSLASEALESPTAVVEPEPKIDEKIEATTIDAEAKEKTGDEAAQKIGEPPAEIPERVVEQSPNTEPAPPVSEPQVSSEVVVQEAQASQESEKAAPVIESAEPVISSEVPAEKPNSEKVSGEPVPVSSAPRSGGMDDMAKRESETAAAWATWRKIRESGGPKTPQTAETSADERDESVPQEAAMAVAAGAETQPEEPANFDADPEIASIVDSVLADMRPRIVEEIARKLGKKK